jgi:amino-acid N-acetyltransferase
VQERNDLPTQDVRSNPEWFYLAAHDGERIGIGGIEPYGTVGLLRSVVIERAKRENGYGTALCEALETEAKRDGVETLYVLTTTATAFFASRNHVETARSDVPRAIQQTTEFDDLCPATATCMRKSL